MRTLREILTEHREREERFAGYHRQMIQRGEASDWSERAAEESDRAEALEWAIAALAKAEGRS